jgi:hypothetical protein
MVGEGVGVGVGDGEGVGVGVVVGVGVGVGEVVDVGDGATCACADETTPIASTKTIASSRANARAARIPSARDEQRIELHSRKSARSKKSTTSRSAGLDLRPVHAERQLVTVLTKD